MSPPEKSVSGCSRVVYSKKRTHNYGWICGVCQKRNITGIRYNVDPAKLHVDPDIDVAKSAISQYDSDRGILERDIRVILRPCIEALGRLHALGSDAYLRGKSVCQRCRRQMSITLTSPKLDNTQRTRTSKSVRTNEDNGPLLFDGGVDIIGAFWEDRYDKCWRSFCLPLTLIARSTELL